ncbi:DddA-like double-stranded DNA deaminase toxin [Streptomyces sp. NPDC057386]|uniref:DddA-like double-stranded DNA deaminase toxin n=1 Tax=Streptomyces thermocoprophilus TaxID=78356 RepID=A0ABV5VP99_9ACTN
MGGAERVVPDAFACGTKFAAAMKEKGIQHAKVVINNTNGVCKARMNCEKAVQAILPKGWTMEVYYPGDRSPVLLTGERLAP